MEIDVIQKLNRLISHGQVFLNSQIEILRKNDAFNESNWDLLKEDPMINNIRLNYFSWRKEVVDLFEKLKPEQKASIEGRFNDFESDYDFYFITEINAALSTIKENLQMVNKGGEQIKSSQGGNKNVFIVHGHSELLISQTESFLLKLGLKPIILREQVNKGQTLIEKLESYSDVAFAIVLYTSCDRGGINDVDAPLKPRARQNVVFEHGYLNAKLGRNRVCALVQKGVEIPGDLSGIVYVEYDENGKWCYDIAKEMRAAKLNVDMNKL